MSEERKVGVAFLRISTYFLVGMFLGKYGGEIIGSICNPMDSFLTYNEYEDYREVETRFLKKPYLRFHTLKHIAKDIFGQPIKGHFSETLSEGTYLYMDKNYLYVDRYEKESLFSEFIHSYVPWIYSERARRRGLKIDKMTGWTFNRERNRWEGNGLICMPFKELEKEARKIPLDSGFRERFGPPTCIWERPDGMSYWEYNEVNFHRVIIAFKNHRFYNIGVIYIVEAKAEDIRLKILRPT